MTSTTGTTTTDDDEKREKILINSSKEKDKKEMVPDPFDVFGSDEEVDDEKNDNKHNQYRDVENGVLSFHNGTEQALLHYVLQRCCNKDKKETSNNNDKANQILQIIDEFCYKVHWMMHLGPEKAPILTKFLLEQCNNNNDDNEYIYQIVELGTYCGYSSILIANTLLQQQKKSPKKFHIYTVDVNVQTQQNVAKQIINAAGLDEYITFVLLDDNNDNNNDNNNNNNNTLSTTLQNVMKDNKTKKIDFLFIDHAKELYLSDLQQLEQNKLIQSGTAVVADNVVFFQLQEYCNYMEQHMINNIVKTELISDNLFLEYVLQVNTQIIQSELPNANDPNLHNRKVHTKDVLRDGMELTVYLKDPPNNNILQN